MLPAPTHLLPQFPSVLLGTNSTPGSHPGSSQADPGVWDGQSAGTRTLQPPPCARSRDGGTGHPQGPTLMQGRAEEPAAPGPVGKALFFSSSIKHFPSLEPRGGFGWEATWLWCCWPRDSSQDEGTSPWPWAGSPSAASRLLPGLSSHRRILPFLWAGLAGDMPQFPYFWKGSASPWGQVGSPWESG